MWGSHIYMKTVSGGTLCSIHSGISFLLMTAGYARQTIITILSDGRTSRRINRPYSATHIHSQYQRKMIVMVNWFVAFLALSAFNNKTDKERYRDRHGKAEM